MKSATPFVKWVGGKRSIITELSTRMPKKLNEYWEAFTGGAALFFETLPSVAHLSDTNAELIITYQVIQQSVEALIDQLWIHQQNHSKDYYYHLRSKNDLTEPIQIAARLIYLNKTCYNGLYRVNKKGEFNTPIGQYAKPMICQPEKLRACSKALCNAIINMQDYKMITPKKNDFVYFDPPYHRITNTSFTAYSKHDFTESDQMQLAEFCKQLHLKKVLIMLSNSNTPLIRSLYPSSIFKVETIYAPRRVNSKSEGRHAVEEVIITNY